MSAHWASEWGLRIALPPLLHYNLLHNLNRRFLLHLRCQGLRPLSIILLHLFLLRLRQKIDLLKHLTLWLFALCMWFTLSRWCFVSIFLEYLHPFQSIKYLLCQWSLLKLLWSFSCLFDQEISSLVIIILVHHQSQYYLSTHLKSCFFPPRRSHWP